jgi:O-acetyl-ADP-ribose deacetylase (regulator of RNase III)
MTISLETHQRAYDLSCNDCLFSLATGLSGAPYAKRHWELSLTSQSAWGHRIVAVLEALPLFGAVVAVIERIFVVVYNALLKPKSIEVPPVVPDSPKFDATSIEVVENYTGDLSFEQKKNLLVQFANDDTLSITFEQAPNILVTIRKQDLFNSGAKVIVNAANTHLGGGGAIDGAIHKIGGPAYAKAHQDLRALYHGQYTQGYAAMISSGNLAANNAIENVIVVAGPQGGTTPKKENELYSCYYNSLKLADQAKKESLAFPSIGTGVFQFPPKRAAAISLKALYDFITEHPQTSVQRISIHFLPSEPREKLEMYKAEGE